MQMNTFDFLPEWSQQLKALWTLSCQSRRGRCRERAGAQGWTAPLCRERSYLSCSRTCFLAGALLGGGWVMAAPEDETDSCALERPPQAWTMLRGCQAPGEAYSAMRLA